MDSIRILGGAPLKGTAAVAGAKNAALPAMGAPPIDMQVEGLRRLGAEVLLEHGDVEARCERLRGAEFRFPGVTVTGTENLMMAATLARGTTLLHNCAQEPEVTDLADLLRAMGARIEGDGTETVRIEGVERLRGAAHPIIPDRIVAGTLLMAAAITRGSVRVEGCRPQHLLAVTDLL